MKEKDYVKICKARDEKLIIEDTARIENLIKNELYPQRFEFPLMLQLELTAKCNVFCKHCYNDSENKIL